MAQMRAERTKENMKELQSKPHISENSRFIAQHSKRAKENAEVIERLLSPDAKKGKFFASPVQPSRDQIPSSSQMSRNRNSQGQGQVQVQGRNSSQFEEFSNQNDNTSQNKSIYRKKEKEASISITKNETKAFETFNPPEVHEIDELHHEYQQSHPELEMIDTLHPSSSTKSLQKEVSDRLAIALAKRNSSKTNLFDTQNYQTAPTSAAADHHLTAAIKGALSPHGIGKKGRTQSSQNRGFRLAPELVDTPVPGSGHESTAMRTPKHIYLKVSPKLGHDVRLQEKPSNSILSQSKTEVTSESLRNQFGHLTSVHNAESTIEEYEKEQNHPHQTDHDLTNESIQTEHKKRSVRQPTFGVSNSHMFTNMSSKKSSFGNSPHKQDLRVLEPRKENIYHDTMKENQPLTSKMFGGPTHESLLNSWKLRQQVFSNTREHKLSIATQGSSSGNTLRIRDENQTPKSNIMMDKENFGSPETNVYLRNAMWLSAKNNKVAVQQVNKERQEMQECTFHPQLDEKTYMMGLISPKQRNCKSRLIDRKDSTKSTGNKTSYRDLRTHHRAKGSEKQNQTATIRSSAKAEALLNMQDDSQEPKISIELREDGQKYYLL